MTIYKEYDQKDRECKDDIGHDNDRGGLWKKLGTHHGERDGGISGKAYLIADEWIHLTLAFNKGGIIAGIVGGDTETFGGSTPIETGLCMDIENKIISVECLGIKGGG